MRRFKKILIVNNDKTTKGIFLDQATRLALNNEALVTIIEVHEDFPKSITKISQATTAKDLQKIISDGASERLTALSEKLQAKGIESTWKILRGTQFVEIIREVVNKKIDLVMVEPDPKPLWSDILFDSLVMHLMRKCPCPVWVVKPIRKKKSSRILASIDLESPDKVKQNLNIKIMEIATSLAQFETGILHILNCWDIPYEKYFKRNLPLHEFNAISRERRNEQKKRFEDLLIQFSVNDLNFQSHFLKGNPGIQIPKFARKKNIDLVVMGTVCRTGVAGLFIGNTAEKTLQQLQCSVLALKPDGFVTPVSMV